MPEIVSKAGFGYIHYMKTTVDIPDRLLQQARKLAGELNISLKTLIESALRGKILEHQQKPKSFELTVTTFEGNGLQSGLSWDNASEIREMIYEGRGGLPR